VCDKFWRLAEELIHSIYILLLSWKKFPMNGSGTVQGQGRKGRGSHMFNVEKE
jgi:hypothetical protein